MEKLNCIMSNLKQVKGLANFNILSDNDKLAILKLEEPCNIGVLEAISRPYALVLTHDSCFREPAAPIVKEGLFPPVPFPEIMAKQVVSSSPSTKVHEFIVSRFNLSLRKEDATLLIGFKL